MIRRPGTVTALGLLALFLPDLPAARAAEARLLADLAPGELEVQMDFGNQLLTAAALAGRAYFAARSLSGGTELWSTDGTPEGTGVVRDLCPGPCSSYAWSPVAVGDAVYFVAADPLDDGVQRLYRSDGSAAGTHLVASADPGGLGIVDPFLYPSGDRLWLTAFEDDRVRFWVVDGQRARRVHGVCRGGCSLSGITPDGHGGLFFGATVDGTRYALDYLSPSGDVTRVFEGPPANFVTAGEGGSVAFATYRDGFGWEVWVAGTTAASARQLTGTCGGCLDLRFLRGLHGLPDGGFAFVAGGAGRENALWATDGTAAGTRLVLGQPAITIYGDMVTAAGRSFFTVGRGSGFELWVTDATASGTRPLPVAGHPDGLGLSAGDDRVFFYGFGLLGWSDGTDAGTRVLQGAELPADLGAVLRLVAVPGGAVFAGRAPGQTWGEDPWWTDGTRAGTRRLVELGRAPASSEPHRLTPFADALLFAARDDDSQIESTLWRFGAGGLADLARVPGDVTAIEARESMALIGSTTALLATDGTPEGTEVFAPSLGCEGPFARFRGRSYFAGSSLELGLELWRTDGAAAGTELVRDLDDGTLGFPFPHPASGFPRGFLNLGPRLLFRAQSPTGTELWTSDGTAAGTGLVADLRPGYDSSDPSGLTRPPTRPRRAIFAATDAEGDRELWRSDGTAAGTALLADLLPAAPSSPSGFVVLGGRVLFFATLPNGGEGLFRSDGTSRGTHRVTPLKLAGEPVRVGVPGLLGLSSDGPDRTRVAVAGGSLFFVAFHPTTGHELWVSDGTAAGTHLLVDLLPGPAGSDPGSLAVVDGRLVFAADDGVHGRELWVSDGTAAGTRLLADVAPGANGSNPATPTAFADLLAFVADDGVTGRELWVIDRADVAATP